MRWSTGGSIRLGWCLTLITDDGESLGQSLAIVDWLDRHFPQMPLLPAGGSRSGCGCWRWSTLSACDIHPINNMRVLRYLSDELKVSEADKKRWYAHWIQQGLSAVEQLLRRSANPGRFCFGDATNARRLLPGAAMGATRSGWGVI